MLCIISLSNMATPVAYASQVVVSKLPPPPQNHDTSPVPPPDISQPDSESVLGTSTSLLTVMTGEAQTQGSAAKRIPIRMEQLAKKVYQTSEDVNVTVINPDNDSITASVTDEKGQPVSVPITQNSSGTTTDVQIEGSNEITPGLYTVKVTDQEGDITTQDFTWGVLALNTDKSMYHPGEKADISMAVLDDQGNMVCDAQVALRIQNQEAGIDDTLSTDAASQSARITINPQCQLHDFSLTPDYEAHYTFAKAGTYNLQLTATTNAGVHTITDIVPVTNTIPFDVQRVSATRIYPPDTYPMTFHITAHQDFSGTVTETVPQDFTITPATGSAQTNSYTNMQTMYLNGENPSDQLAQAVLGTGTSSLVMPFHGNYPITQGFGAQMTDPSLQAFYTSYGLAGHDGVDFGVPMDTPLYAVDDGSVIWSGPGDYGITIIIQHSWGESYYGHLSNTSVTVGQQVTKGQLIGYSGESGEATGPHLHFGMRPNNPDMQNGYYGKIDPLPYLPYGHQAEDTSAIGPSLPVPTGTVTPTPAVEPVDINVLGSSTAATRQDTAASGSATPTPESAITAATSSATVTPTPTPAPAATQALNQKVNSNFSVLDKQILFNEQLTNSSQTDKVKVLTWHVTLKKGQTTTLGYDFQTPAVSPQFYLLGPMQFYQNGSNKVVFQEQHQWEIASDDVGVEWYNNTTGNKWNGYSWQYRKKIVINHSDVSATPFEPTILFMDPGGDEYKYGTGVNLTAAQTVFNGPSTFFGNIQLSATSHTGPDSYSLNSSGVGANLPAPAGTIVSTGAKAGRVSFYVYFNTLPDTAAITLLSIYAGATYDTAPITITTGNKIECGDASAVGTTTLATTTWYRMSIGYIQGTNEITYKVYLNGNLAVTCTNVSEGGHGTATNFSLGGNNNGQTIYVDDIYADSGADESDPGDIRVTAKLPIANGATNDYVEHGTIGASSTGCTDSSTPCEYVNERPLNATEYLSTATNADTEAFTIQGASQGDVDISNDQIVGDEAWIYASVGTACAGSIINNGVNTSINLTATDTFFTDPANPPYYPGTAPASTEAVGVKSCNTSGLNLYEAGMLVAYKTGPTQQPMLDAAISYDNTNNSTGGPADHISENTFTVSPSYSNEILILGVSTAYGGTVETGANAPTWGTQKFTLLKASGMYDSDYDVELWYLVAPQQGKETLTVTLTTDSNWVVGLSDYYNVNQVNPFGTDTEAGPGSGSPISNTINSGTNQLPIDVAGYVESGGTLTPGGSQTQAYNENPWNAGLASSYAPSAGATTTVSWTNVDLEDWYDIGVSLQPYTATSLTNFPVLVSLSGDTDLAAHAQSNCSDVVFTDSTGENELNFEIENLSTATDCSSGNLTAWVQIPTLSATSDTIIYMYFGNPSATNQSTNTTWDSNYMGVWHMQQNPGGASPQMTDSTSYGNNGTANGGMTSANSITGEIYNALSFTATSHQYINVGTNSSLNPSGTNLWSVELWYKDLNAGANDTGLVSKAQIGTGGYEINENETGTCTATEYKVTKFNDPNNEGDICVGAVPQNTNWHFLAIEYSSAGVVAYVDGALSLPTAIGMNDTFANTTQATYLGYDNDGDYLKGDEDEVRISNVPRSTGWVATEYNTESASAVSLGSVETKIYAPTLSQLLRHGEFFGTQGAESGIRQPFTF
jgi:murein DD-endopeptidase MepM/ murein hydrolase activator NlpD